MVLHALRLHQQLLARGGQVVDGRVRVRVAAPMAVSIAQGIAGWGATVEVLEPESVKAELARLGSELLERYESK